MRRHSKTSLTRACLVLTVIFLLSVAGRQPDAFPAATPYLSQRINEFTLRFLKHVAKHESGNVILSPQSIYHGLAMSYIASGTKTRSELAAAVGFPDDDVQLMSEMSGLRKSMQSDAKRAEVTLANSAWLDSTHAEFRKDYSGTLESGFGAALHAVTFKDAERVSDTINAWVSENTRGRIRGTVNPGDFASRSSPGVIDEPALVTANAAYFKVDWGSRFEKGGTQKRPFHVDTNRTVNARMMHQSSLLAYAEDATFQFLELPYISDKYSMYVLLPRQVLSAEKMLSLVQSNTVVSLKQAAYRREVDVLFPKFEMRSHCSVKDTLSQMGVKRAFDSGQADFDRMIIKKPEAYRVYLSEIYHDAWVAVDEKGTEAAAATTSIHFSIGCSMPMREMPVDFHADHPFLFFIVHNESRSLLFAGWMVNPNEVVP
jgi:serpin B